MLEALKVRDHDAVSGSEINQIPLHSCWFRLTLRGILEQFLSCLATLGPNGGQDSLHS